MDSAYSLLTLLNTSIITAYGEYRYAPLTLAQARVALQECVAQNIPVQSAIGHAATAELLTQLLEYPVAANRCEFRQEVGAAALVFKLRGRVPEGRILTRAELETIGYDFGWLTRHA